MGIVQNILLCVVVLYRHLVVETVPVQKDDDTISRRFIVVLGVFPVEREECNW